MISSSISDHDIANTVDDSTPAQPRLCRFTHEPWING
jgi:hypothetical protein